ncbi:MAG: PEP-CTERM sorting domain-containing protein [Cyanobacteria bacterium SBLK]|nr:PEP-CTERM sorting domain-containing protein [Cyanobacteria bacterium SBLK]
MLRKKIVQSLGLIAGIILISLSFQQSASAFNLIFHGQPNRWVTKPWGVTGIEDLDVNGMLYDVEFVFGSFDEVFLYNVGDLTELEGMTPMFWDDLDDGKAAAAAIMEALGPHSNEIYCGLRCPFNGFDVFRVPVGAVHSTHLRSWGDNTVPLHNDILQPSDTHHRANQSLYARFQLADNPSLTSVPEPASTVALLAIAGTGFLTTRKRKKVE